MCYYLFLSLMNALFYVDIFVFQNYEGFPLENFMNHEFPSFLSEEGSVALWKSHKIVFFKHKWREKKMQLKQKSPINKTFSFFIQF